MPKQTIRVYGHNNRSLTGCHVNVFGSIDGKLSVPLGSGKTDVDGIFTWSTEKEAKITEILINPTDGHWSIAVVGPAERADCPLIEFPNDGLAWWHHALGFETIPPDQGAGIRIGIIDTGRGDHPAVRHVHDIGTFGGNGFVEETYSSNSHGAHVCGIIAARPEPGAGYWGIAPGAETYSATVVGGEFQADYDIANAIDVLSKKYQVDLINLSLTCEKPSKLLETFIREAEDVGILCICAAGNSQGDVKWPARYARCIAVSAVGSRDGIPRGTFAYGRLSPVGPGAGTNGYAAALFCCRGKQINCCGPGVGIVSTYSSGNGWWDLSGTSMASPAVCATLAAHLARSQKYRSLPRDSGRVKFARTELRKICATLGLDATLEGWGMPHFAENA